MNTNDKPMFKKKNLLFMREENEGHWTLLPKFHPETRELIINVTSKMILDLCDGSMTVDEITEKMSNTFCTVGEEQIRKDLIGHLRCAHDCKLLNGMEKIHIYSNENRLSAMVVISYK